MNIKDIARIAHEINRAYCAAIGDDSQSSWDDAPDWQRESAVNGVRFHLENPDALPSDSHVEWMRVKTLEGWTCGPIKDPLRKEHPCMVPYDWLPLEQRVKDHLFIAIVRLLSGGKPA